MKKFILLMTVTVMSFLFYGQSTYVIPVVFHVIHENGAENISDAQILDQIKILNRDYSNPDTSIITDSFKSIVADCDIEFRLATLDPQGNCTSGITRHYSTFTQTGDHAVKSIVHWPPHMYLNFYIVENAAGLAGHALLPSQADSIEAWDGIVMTHQYVGSIGTSNVQRSVVGTHEVGHFLGLEHVWGGNNVPNFPYLQVGQTSNCGTDDGIGDTPNTIGNVTCNLTQMNCGSLDNVQNFMDYSYCGAMFTEGQKIRMHQTLNDTIANRNNLWSTANLIATGTDVPSTQLCEVIQGVSNQMVCVGDTIFLEDLSYHYVASRYWKARQMNDTSTILDSLIITSQDSIGVWPTMIPGVYGVALAATDSLSGYKYSDTTKVVVLSSSGPAIVLSEDLENLDLWSTPDWVVTKKGWEISTLAAYSGTHSLNVNNFDHNYLTEIQTRNVDLSTSATAEVAFRYAYQQREAGALDRIRISFSKDCGDTWTIFSTMTIGSLLTNFNTDTVPFIPAQQDWLQKRITIPASYLVDNFRVKIEFEGTSKGNNVYLDDINIGNPDDIGVEELMLNNIVVYPNPMDDELKVSNLPKQTDLILFDTKGRVVWNKLNVTQDNFVISTQGLKTGIYYLSVRHKTHQKVVKVNKL